MIYLHVQSETQYLRMEHYNIDNDEGEAYIYIASQQHKKCQTNINGITSYSCSNEYTSRLKIEKRGKSTQFSQRFGYQGHN